ncbi:hypothetical protein ACWDWO_03620 [Actinopolymorpha singaporensis]|uniref:Uncharacterized protein n=1 Tax=Actinopolymorpha singaporensis TaxID=117157 RepID=A0A1H1YET5_9ACTN|nr:hypothetical protein [Actinopolymorpha singaporensis]SDT19526.1 hypothetical protein SAMN04489717_5433 [Actinopolymorpha singaporensis]
MASVVLLAQEGPELPVPGPVFGLIAFLILFILLAITLAFGKGRPHA